MPSTLRAAVLLLAVLSIAGCINPVHSGKSPLLPAQMSPDSVALDMFFVRFPFGDADANEKIWQEIDEQQISSDVRERLNRNGFRVGVIGGQMPIELSKLMELSDKTTAVGEDDGVNVENIQAKPRVVRRHLQIRTGQPSEIIASGIYPELTVLVSDMGQPSGHHCG